MDESDLGSAYSRAGAAFVGQLSQNFVVLREEPNRIHDRFFATPKYPSSRGHRAGPSWRGHRGESSAGTTRSKGQKRCGEENLGTKMPF